MIEVASLRYGVIFKKAFCQPHIFSAFAKAFTGIDIEIDEVETEKSFSPVIGKKQAAKNEGIQEGIAKGIQRQKKASEQQLKVERLKKEKLIEILKKAGLNY